jgi:hypothetical protein
LKYITTKAETIDFQLNNKEYQNLYHTGEFFKYLYQKYPFTTTVQKIKLAIKNNVTEKDFFSLFLTIQKYVNKYMFCKKMMKQTNPPKISEFNEKNKTKSSFLIKINFGDCIYRVKQVKNLAFKTPQLNYFGLFAFTSKYSNEKISKLLFNENNNEYDHLLPIFVQNDNFGYFLEYVKFFMKKHLLDNIKLPPIVIDPNRSEVCISNSNDTFATEMTDIKLNTMQESNKLQLLLNVVNSFKFMKFIDISFIIFARNPEELHIQVANVIKSIDFKFGTDFIIRFYLFSNQNIFGKNAEEFKNAFKKGIILAPAKTHSHMILYIFLPKIIRSVQGSNVNPLTSDEILEKELIKAAEAHTDIISSLRGSKRTNADSRGAGVQSIIMTKDIVKIYSKTCFQIFCLINGTYCKRSILRKIRKNTILSKIARFLSVNLYENHLDCPENQGDLKDTIFTKFYEIQQEHVIPTVKYPKNVSELHEDLPHIHFDQAYNLLRIQRPLKM